MESNAGHTRSTPSTTRVESNGGGAGSGLGVACGEGPMCWARDGDAARGEGVCVDAAEGKARPAPWGEDVEAGDVFCCIRCELIRESFSKRGA